MKPILKVTSKIYYDIMWYVLCLNWFGLMNVIDLFAGVGGLSLGAARAGFKVKAAVELDPFAISTHALNFPASKHFMTDVSKINGKKFLESLSINSLDGLIGGPPCQGFSSMGKGMANDVRNDLYKHFYRLIKEMQPRFFLAENVPGILSKKYNHILNEAFSVIEGDYFILPAIKVKASDFGAPTTRTRIFFIGYHKSLGEDFIAENDFQSKFPISPVTVKEALFGLPEFIDSEWLLDEQGWQEINKGVTGPFYNKLWGEIPPNVGDTFSINMLSKSIVSGCLGTRHSEEVVNRYSLLTHGMVDKVSRSQKLDPDGFCPTLRAGTANDKGSYQAVRPIHPNQNRVITPREAARLQGFPDWFRFHTTKWHSFRQIGNSVSPIVAEHILKRLHIRLIEQDAQLEGLNHDPLEIRI